MQHNGSHPTVAIVGAGPAGLAAARTLGRYGIRATLVDEGPATGGQYYKHYSAASTTSRGRELDTLNQLGHEKGRALERLPVDVRTGATVWGFFEPNQLALTIDDEVELLEPDVTLFASGAVERVSAFPGWTLPGVMTAGGAQRLLSHEGVLVGKRFVLAGTGPLLLAIAAEIAEAGGEIAAAVDCVGLTEPVRDPGTAWRAFRQPGRFRQWVDYRRVLRRLNIPYLHNHTVVEARGEEHVSNVVIARKDADWRLIPGTEQTIEADTLALHYGFAASVELPQVAGCELDHDPARGGWYVVHDDDMRSTQSGIYVAGQLTGIGGADLAEATGELAGLTIATDLGLLPAEVFTELAWPVRKRVDRGRAFAEMLNTVYTPGSGVGSLVESGTWICRCEEVAAEQVDQAVETGAGTLNDIKRHTRCGMGFCQGRICAQTLQSYLEHEYGIGARDAGLFNARVPVKPVSLGALATIPESADTDESSPRKH